MFKADWYYLKEYLQDKVLSIMYGFLVFISFIVEQTSTNDSRTCENPQIRHCFKQPTIDFLGAACVFGWMNLLACLTGIRFFAVSVFMLNKMIWGDTAKFVVLYVCTLAGFGTAIYSQFAHFSDARLANTAAERSET